MRKLDQVLTGLGLDLTDWTLQEARGVSGDGLSIVGYGLNPSGDREAFIAIVPEPSATLLGTVALFIVACCGARSNRSSVRATQSRR
jgi:hypothetical protein